MSHVKLYDVSMVASQWRDLSEGDQRKEKMVKMALIVGGVIVLIGSVIAIYFLAKAPSTAQWCDGCKTIHVTSPKGFIAFPVIFGFGGGSAMLVFGLKISFESCTHGSAKDLSTPAARHELMLLLAKGDLGEVYKTYYKKNGGLGPLVQKGYMLSRQGYELRDVLQTYEVVQKTISSFMAQPLCKKEIEGGNAPEEYAKAVSNCDQLKQRWESLRQQLASQYCAG